MKESTYNTRMLGLVTLYNPPPQNAAANIKRYIGDVDALIIWDNSPLESDLQQQVMNALAEESEKVVWHGDGQNHCIAPAINYAWHYAVEHHFDFLLLMDQDSKWKDFNSYRKDIERLFIQQKKTVFTPYVEGCDSFPIVEDIHHKSMFINSGTVIPTQALTCIGGVDEKAFPLDAVDHDMSLSITKCGYTIVCLTKHRLIHSLGHPQRLGIFHIYTPNYNRYRTYSMTRSHTICYRKHKTLLSKEQKKYYYHEILFWKVVRIILSEPDKFGRMKAFLFGFISGYKYRIKT